MTTATKTRRRRKLTPEQQARSDAKRQRMAEIIKTIAGMDDAQRAAIAAKFPIVNTKGHPLSAANSCLIAHQCGDAMPTIVGGYRQWQEQGRQVKGGEHGYSIWVPTGPRKTDADTGEVTTETSSGKRRFILGTVFDVSQTCAAE